MPPMLDRTAAGPQRHAGTAPEGAPASTRRPGRVFPRAPAAPARRCRGHGAARDGRGPAAQRPRDDPVTTCHRCGTVVEPLPYRSRTAPGRLWDGSEIRALTSRAHGVRTVPRRAPGGRN
ncbi:hypothetical protein GCM10018793_38280 [Streptomyces sulfonofaciens]|uniref:Uncharacterized protein n=1 Tax=Streptomyces sulfonofaciens TaxID=68272 RepID=A0A919GC40_9ACTN|nr:hypothetical protein GCM10018793_38280 [Streptomyces sulfonofaciens]